MDIKGKVHEIGETAQVTDSLRKRELVVEYAENPQYPEYIKFEAIQDRTALMDGLAVGDDVEVSFNLKGRPWTNREGKTVYFTTLQLWKVNKVNAAAPAAGAAPQQQTPQYAPPVDLNAGSSDDDDLPF
ncbi:MAG: DUF3127 domain-containing protein [Mucilaginibacter polytrichastri]|nr:DUF3127 domain-containing protein [Mucilaginibacter polytrichastri]